jgi:hypothetical protein
MLADSIFTFGNVGSKLGCRMIVAVPVINRRTLLTTLAAAALYRGSAFAQAPGPVCTENPIRVDGVAESPKLAE